MPQYVCPACRIGHPSSAFVCFGQDAPAPHRATRVVPADPREQLDPPAIAPECPRCGQQSTDYLAICNRCRSGDRETQGTQDRLFTPTAAPINGQQTL